MCGIAGIFAYGDSAPPVDSQELLKTREAMARRGPDGAGLWISGDQRVGLAHRRLSIIDLSESGAQPMGDAEGALKVVFNGEIYNYRELRRQLENRGHRFLTQSDTEVLLHLYREHGQRLVDYLRGMYAFALWDETEKSLLLARDPFGIKPLYYADDGRSLRFASQVKALLKGGALDTSPEPAGQAGFFLWGYVPEPYTCYQGIRGLEAGSVMTLKYQGSVKIEKFCSISRELAAAEESAAGRELDREQVRERLQAALADSVGHHLIADVPVGLFLSAGLDSSTVAALACREGGELNSVTLGFGELKGSDRDETILAAKVAEQLGTNHQTRWISRDEFRDQLRPILEAMDQPSVDGINTYFVAQAAAGAGMKAALSGLGGDELFGGYPSFRDLPRTVRALSWTAAWPRGGRLVRRLAAPVVKRFSSPKYAGLLEYGGTYGGAYLLRRALFMPWELPEVMDQDLAWEGWQKLQPLVRLEETVQGMAGDYLKVAALEMVWYMRNQLLRDSDWAGMAHSLEIRVPLVDIALLRQLAPLLISDRRPSKREMAAAAPKPLPAEVLNRAKTGFYVPVREWLAPTSGRKKPQPDRGLRGWAQLVYHHHMAGP
jgi:asparagine synthase (glutamine-hydrolysing)